MVWKQANKPRFKGLMSEDVGIFLCVHGPRQRTFCKCVHVTQRRCVAEEGRMEEKGLSVSVATGFNIPRQRPNC